MNPTPTQPSATPRTDAAYFAEGATMYSLAGEMKLVERELTAAQSMQSLACRKLDEAEKQLAAAKAECERLRGLLKSSTVAHSHDIAELARLRAEVEKLTIADHAWRTAAKFDAHNAEVLQTEIERLKEGRPVVSASLYDETLVRAERAEAEVERLKKRIKDDNRSYGCELRDPNGTIWEQAAKDHARAEKAEAENERLKELGDKWAIDARNEAERAERAELELAAARKEIEVLRWWGNKDCTAMADAALKGIIP